MVEPTTHLATWYSQLLIAYKPEQHATGLNAIGNCITTGSICVSKHTNLTGSPPYMWLIDN